MGGVGALVAVGEGGRAHPGLERLLVAPAGDDQPCRALVGRLQQLEALEAVLVVDCADAGGEATGQLLAGSGVDGDGVDLDDGHHDDATGRPHLPCDLTRLDVVGDTDGASDRSGWEGRVEEGVDTDHLVVR